MPLLLSSGYHLAADIAAAAQLGRARGSPRRSGPIELLLTALTARLAEAGVPDGTPVVLAAAGSSDPAAPTDVAAAGRPAGRAPRRAGPRRVRRPPRSPTVPEAVAELREQTGKPVAVASYLLAPGHFQDQLQQTRRRLGDRAARRPPGAGRPGHRPVPDGIQGELSRSALQPGTSHRVRLGLCDVGAAVRQGPGNHAIG